VAARVPGVTTVLLEYLKGLWRSATAARRRGRHRYDGEVGVCDGHESWAQRYFRSRRDKINTMGWSTTSVEVHNGGDDTARRGVEHGEEEEDDCLLFFSRSLPKRYGGCADSSLGWTG
jgi:hypothetical protein